MPIYNIDSYNGHASQSKWGLEELFCVSQSVSLLIEKISWYELNIDTYRKMLNHAFFNRGINVRGSENKLGSV